MTGTHYGQRLGAAIARWKQLIESQRDHPDATALLRDIEASLRDLPLITKPMAGPSVLMPLRLRLLGVDPAYLEKTDQAAYARLEAGCAACQHWRQCARDLAVGDLQSGLDLYCKNSSHFDDLVLMRET
jgi:hypothetical protein